MNNDEITYITDNNNIEVVNENELPKVNPINEETLQVPDWDLTPPFDSLDRSDIS